MSDQKELTIPENENSVKKSKGGRPPKRKELGIEQSDASQAKRPKRTPIYAQHALKSPGRSGFVRRWVNDTQDRIQRFRNAGYTPVVADYDETSGNIKDGEGTNNIVTKQVNPHSTEGMTAVLMEIPKEYYDEDQAAKKLENDRLTDDLIKPRISNNQYGLVKINN